uniref:G-protein coupled receptors family 1 profile domain-containing protein n=1 Tax=Callorhinchus milii TaxID=7868 RepID=A0A4W3JIN6_CALMI
MEIPCSSFHKLVTTSLAWDLLGLKVSLSVVMAVITLATILSNLFVIVAVCLTRKLHTPANYLIASLAVTDLLVALLVMPISIAFTMQRTWVLGQVMCNIWVLLDVTLCTVSILHLCIIALDRYWAITHALKYTKHRTPFRAGLMIAAAWGIAVCISTSPLFWISSRTQEKQDECVFNENVFYCIFATCVSFYIPSLVLVFLYAKIYLAARSRILRAPSTKDSNIQHPEPTSSSQCSVNYNSQDMLNYYVEQPDRLIHIKMSSNFLQKKNISAAKERKATKTLGLILGAFIFCWLPFFTTTLVITICQEACWSNPVLIDFFTWLGFVNSLINPVIYTIFNKNFKRAFRKLVLSRLC